MRRDYFLCFFLFSIATSLMFVCFAPLYFTYDIVVLREFSLLERLCSCLFTLAVLVVIPALAAYKRKFWITAGLMSFGILAYIPGWILPGMTPEIAGSEAKIGSVIWAYCLKSIYGVVNAPFASLSKLLGDKGALCLSKMILPTAIIMYIAVQLFRFYREAYIRDKLSSQQDDPTIERGEPARAAESEEHEVLGTVVMAPSVKAEQKPVKTENTNNVKKANKAIPSDVPLKKEDVILLGAPASNNVIQLGPPPKAEPSQPQPQPQLQPQEQAMPSQVSAAPSVPASVPTTAPAPTVAPSVTPAPTPVASSASTKPKPQADTLKPMDKMFADFISSYEKQTHKKISDEERKQLYVKFVELYKQQNGGK
ncbi:MAG: hypothetical protein MJ153_06815 [Clostridia bacterium]|nr:hypothetical protein [Clostridia bacterium]